MYDRAKALLHSTKQSHPARSQQKPHLPFREFQHQLYYWLRFHALKGRHYLFNCASQYKQAEKIQPLVFCVPDGNIVLPLMIAKLLQTDDRLFFKACKHFFKYCTLITELGLELSDKENI